MDDIVQSWLVIMRTPGVGPAQVNRLVELFGSPENILSAPDKELKDIGLSDKSIRYFKSPEKAGIKNDLDWLNQPEHYLVTQADDDYPPLLREIPDAPPALFVSGRRDILKLPQIAMVGSRNPSHMGRQSAREFAAQLSGAGFVINSGLAVGIDYCSHVGALDSSGYTIAVLGNGLDSIYPARHRSLAEKIRSAGAVISEFATGMPPLPENFPRRNRIISGMSLGVVVMEAVLKSGSLITAGHALDQGRDVFAVPGSIYNPLARGCHHLIKQGAKLTECVEDIIEELRFQIEPGFTGIAGEPARQNVIEGLDPDSRLLLECMGYDPVSTDTLIELTGLTAEAVSSMLSMLEVQGMVNSKPGGLYMRTNPRLF